MPADAFLQEIKYLSDSETKIIIKLFRKEEKAILILGQLKGRQGVIVHCNSLLK